MSSRRGFTLIEVMLAITLTGIVAVLVYGAAAVALDTETRLSDHERALRAEWAWNAVLVDALRNLRATADYPQPTLVVSPGFDPLGRPRDRLQFVTAGGTPPLTGDADWTVTVEANGSGVSLTASPIGVLVAARRVTAPKEVTGLRVRVLAGTENPEWLEGWTDRRRMPRAIEITHWTDSGPIGVPLLLTLPLESVP